MQPDMRIALVCLAVLAAPSTALAQERPTGTYVGAGIGANFATDTEMDGGGVNAEIDTDLGYAGTLALGQAYANGIRAEIEIGRRANDVDSVDGLSTGGGVDVMSGMLNAYYDFTTGSAFIPYLGAGIGAAVLDVNTSPVDGRTVNGHDTGLALQGIAGIGYQLDDNWTGSLEYRYFTVRGADIATSATQRADADYASHAVMLGLRYTFGVPKQPMAEPAPAPQPVAQPAPKPEPAPPAPPAPPPIPRNYLVFFDWDRSDITAEARAILRSAAENARKGGISRIEATGHADRSGSQTYNLRLSERRAIAVREELSRMGVPASQVAIDFKGEAEPLVPTADGVREPQNRRVEIVFP